jgi:hypothetical protein
MAHHHPTSGGIAMTLDTARYILFLSGARSNRKTGSSWNSLSRRSPRRS